MHRSPRSTQSTFLPAAGNLENVSEERVQMNDTLLMDPSFYSALHKMCFVMLGKCARLLFLPCSVAVLVYIIYQKLIKSSGCSEVEE